MKKAFSLVELIVVIAIIGVLAGILFTSFSGGTESARAAKCLTNMRNLSQAAIGFATRKQNVSGSSAQAYPAAGSRAVMSPLVSSDGSIIYLEDVGWISWLSKDDPYHMHRRSNGGHGSKSFVAVPNVSAYSTKADDPDALFALTNGLMWGAVNGNRETYVCPEHQRVCAKKGITVNWSYVMNAYFGYDYTDGGDAVGIGIHSGRVTLNSSRLERTLLFAELPFNDHEIGGAALPPNFTPAPSPENDCVLQYKAGTIDGEEFENNWKGTPESIAFNHRSGKRGWCAHVAFADGHTEKLLLPKGGLSKTDLTALLCGDDDRHGGKDISFNGTEYQKLKD